MDCVSGEIESGGSKATFASNPDDPQSELYDMSFDWDDQRRVLWVCDVAEGPGWRPRSGVKVRT